ncbi:alpha-D-ribose 1-methylphosphonate 5-triphosphate diphosphatase [Planktotalea arctica]|uniref:alpha-D-ribose 1-methylphosphonate 5-triphosphate diphosphatase n=1 Tax=Planktotalea arctica TaxID=1481893 RepID=UPI000A1769DB|nr:alpha-D-ribose 1-methylphosphonate 5-triphosphate diphosphatase [Planktotalea arctica]
MTNSAVDLSFEGGEVLLADGSLGDRLTLSQGRISDGGGTGARRVDARGFRFLPGIVDIHGDGFERHLAPRRGAMTDMRAGIASAEADLASNGITTAVMAQFYSWEGGLRAPEFARKFLDALDVTRADQLIDMRAQLRVETHMIDDYADMLALIEAHGIGYVVLNDHIPHKRLDEGRKPARLTGTALKSGRSPEAHLALMQALHARRGDVPCALAEFAQRLIEAGCLIGSHDDHSAVQRAQFRAMGAQISEFPETREAAEAARSGGGHIILGAPNVMRGGSHAGNVSAVDLIREGLCDALASDYHYPALRQSVGKLVAAGACDFPRAWALLSSGPAAILGLHDRGTLSAGLRADVLVEDCSTGRIAASFASGRVTYLQGAFAARMLNG